jgi:hypothetical protein
MPIEDRDLKAGTRLVAQYKGQDRSCEVVETDDKLFLARRRDGVQSPVVGGQPSDRRRHIERLEVLEVAGAVGGGEEGEGGGEDQGAVKPKAKKSRKKRGEEAKAQRAASGESYGCGVCGESFSTMKAATAHAQEAHLS